MVLIMSGFFDGIGKPHLSALVSLCAAAVIVVTDLLLIPVWGVRGAAFGSSLGYLSAFLLTLAVFTSESHRLRSRNVD
jgi:Na+-driven multidrug efflux pump